MAGNAFSINISTMQSLDTGAGVAYRYISRGATVARVLFLLCRDFLLTKWTLRVRGHLLLCCSSRFSPARAPLRARRGWKVRRKTERTGVAVLSQACNARGHRSRNISCQAGSNGREGGQLDTDYPRSASDDPRGRPCKNSSSPASTLRAFTFAVYGAGHIKRNM